MDGIGGVLGMIAAIIAILSALIGAVVYVNGSYNKARITSLREDNDDLRNRVEDLEKREDRLTLQVDHLSAENETLKQLVTQRANVDEVMDALTKHHDAAMKELNKIHRAIVYKVIEEKRDERG